ncbi:MULTISPECIES: CHAT domain-containing protein [unclassified Nocardiopsis]|uniref:CHAT domain-containing protein n=1 Tax=Nocardiopsis TaxID=2013 RepID=UPI00387B31C8
MSVEESMTFGELDDLRDALAASADAGEEERVRRELVDACHTLAMRLSAERPVEEEDTEDAGEEDAAEGAAEDAGEEDPASPDGRSARTPRIEALLEEALSHLNRLIEGVAPEGEPTPEERLDLTGLLALALEVHGDLEEVRPARDREARRADLDAAVAAGERFKTEVVPLLPWFDGEQWSETVDSWFLLGDALLRRSRLAVEQDPVPPDALPDALYDASSAIAAFEEVVEWERLAFGGPDALKVSDLGDALGHRYHLRRTAGDEEAARLDLDRALEHLAGASRTVDPEGGHPAAAVASVLRTAALLHGERAGLAGRDTDQGRADLEAAAARYRELLDLVRRYSWRRPADIEAWVLGDLVDCLCDLAAHGEGVGHLLELLVHLRDVLRSSASALDTDRRDTAIGLVMEVCNEFLQREDGNAPDLTAEMADRAVEVVEEILTLPGVAEEARRREELELFLAGLLVGRIQIVPKEQGRGREDALRAAGLLRPLTASAESRTRAGAILFLGMTTMFGFHTRVFGEEDVDLALSLFEDLPAEHREAAGTLGTLIRTGLLMIKESLGTGGSHLDKVIAGLQGVPDDAPDEEYFMALHSLGEMLSLRYFHSGDLADAENAYATVLRQLDLIQRHPEIRAWLAPGGLLHLRVRGQFIGAALSQGQGLGWPDIPEQWAREIAEEARALDPIHPHRGVVLGDLGLLLFLAEGGDSGRVLGEGAGFDLLMEAARTGSGSSEAHEDLARLRAAGAVLAVVMASRERAAATARVTPELLTEVMGWLEGIIARDPGMVTLRARALLAEFAHERFVRARSYQDLATADRELGRICEEIDPAHPLAAELWWRSAAVAQATGHLLGSDRIRRAENRSLEALVHRTWMQPGTEQALAPARQAAARAARAAHRELCFPGADPAHALGVLEAGRGLLLQVATGDTGLTEILHAVGEGPLAEEWAAHLAAWGPGAEGAVGAGGSGGPGGVGGPEGVGGSEDPGGAEGASGVGGAGGAGGADVASEAVGAGMPGGPGLTGAFTLGTRTDDLRHRVVRAVAATPAFREATHPPDTAAISRALRRLGRDALVFLVPAPSAGRGGGRALVITADGGARTVELPDLVEGAEAVTRFHRAREELRWQQPGDALSPIRREGFRGALGGVLAWARGAIAPLASDADLFGAGRVPRLVLSGVGEMAALPWHAAMLDRAVVSHTVTARGLVEASLRAPADLTAAPVLVQDPTGSLSFSGPEVLALIRDFYPGRSPLGEGGAVPVGELLPHLAGPLRGGASMLHLSTHLLLGALPQESRVPLGGEDLTVAHLLAAVGTVAAGDPGAFVALMSCASDLSSGGQEQALSLASAFLVAGAATVVASRWQVPDGRTAVLSYLMHHYLVREGLDPAGALHAAQLCMADPRNHPPPVAVPEEFAWHPDPERDAVCWAAFTHQGW